MISVKLITNISVELDSQNIVLLMSLVYLDLLHNQISGSIPKSLRNKMPTLKSLLLNDNFINCSLLSSLGKLEIFHH
ncbi:hypothetical protein Ahy_A05g021991 isoform C [Arachis hypogaea]|uniref:LRR receptor-like serine/threonine-protein kinase n=1 Tax=Arachis hypogaea TaxID=3818 RepID=A0A445CZ33_ARAHY|nr:hypothetical protein Ahy_A05g021991 isoform C [Arachis hypogaea]